MEDWGMSCRGMWLTDQDMVCDDNNCDVRPSNVYSAVCGDAMVNRAFDEEEEAYWPGVELGKQARFYEHTR